MRIMQFVLQVNNALENALEYKNMCQCMHLLFLIRVWFLLSNIKFLFYMCGKFSVGWYKMLTMKMRKLGK